ncbi:hypothetical protein EDC01DRAFT_636883 [Geopyxis carbonaria]|nr:hypothetical protein EDC01DRAFT_636883 [Geopyxis carbonaria]
MWGVDTCATDFICNDRKLFTEIYPCSRKLKLGDATMVDIPSQGTILLFGLSFPALFSPHFCINLMSVPTLDRLGWSSHFSNGIGILTSPDKYQYHCSIQGGIYLLTSQIQKITSSSYITTRSESRQFNIPLVEPLTSDRITRSAAQANLLSGSSDTELTESNHHDELKQRTETPDSPQNEKPTNIPSLIVSNDQNYLLDDDSSDESAPENDEIINEAIKDMIRSKKNSKSRNVTVFQWHQRMGHANPENIRKALGDRLGKIPSHIPCDVCIQAKMKQKSKQ